MKDEDYFEQIYKRTLKEKLKKLNPLQKLLFTLDYNSWLIGFTDGLQEAKQLMEEEDDKLSSKN